jgi:hypothetical protein
MVRKLAPRNSGKWLNWIVLDEGADVSQNRGEQQLHKQQGLRPQAHVPEVDL